jgi:NitT/TauT family transport system permease protein
MMGRSERAMGSREEGNVAVEADIGPNRRWPGNAALYWTSTTSIVGGLLIWEIVGRFVVKNALFLTTPTQIVAATFQLIAEGDLQRHVAASASEFFIGLVIAILLGIGVGFAMASDKYAKRALGPWVAAFYATPTIAISPLIILWAGIGIWSKVIVVIINAIFPMIINTEAGLRSTDKQLIEAARCFGCSRLQVFWKISLPSAVPFLFAGIKLTIGRGLVAVVVAELFGSRAGLGFLLAQASDAFNMPLLFVSVVLLAVTGMTLTWLVGAIERLLMPWRTLSERES